MNQEVEFVALKATLDHHQLFFHDASFEHFEEVVVATKKKEEAATQVV